MDFVAAALINAFAGLAVATATRRFRRELKPRDGFLLVTLSWALMSASAAVPFMIALPDLGFTDAYFEAVSGLTTTGSTVLNHLDDLPQSINLWRHTLHWIGGIGIIVLAVAVLPLLGVGGMQLYKAETPGPGQGRKAHAAHHRDRQVAVVHLPGDHGDRHRRAAHRRHELVRRHLPLFFGDRARRLFHARQERGLLQLHRHRAGAGRSSCSSARSISRGISWRCATCRCGLTGRIPRARPCSPCSAAPYCW